MSLEAMEIICQAEEAAEKLKEETVANAKRALEQTKEDGKAAMEQLESKIIAELKEKNEQAQLKAKAEVDTIARETELIKAELMGKAENKLGEAVEYIVERIVNG